MKDIFLVVLGGLIGIAVAIVKDFLIRKSDKEKWLLDRENRECTECIDLLWTASPPQSREDLNRDGWRCDDFNGRMDSLRHVPAKMAALILYQSHRGKSTVEFDAARKDLIEQIKVVRAEQERVVGGNKVKSPHGLPQAIDTALDRVEEYLRFLRSIYQPVEISSEPSGMFRNMNWAEKWFLKTAIGTHVATFIATFFYVYSNSPKFYELQFWFAYAACILVFCQFIIRYIAVTNRFKTQTTASSWIVSFLIMAMSNVSTVTTIFGSTWFLFFGLLLIMGTLVTQMSRNRIKQSNNPDPERLMRLQEYMTFEAGFGCLMLLVYGLSKALHNQYIGALVGSSVNAETVAFFGSLFAFYYSVVSVVVNSLRVAKHRQLIQDLIRAQE